MRRALWTGLAKTFVLGKNKDKITQPNLERVVRESERERERPTISQASPVSQIAKGFEKIVGAYVPVSLPGVPSINLYRLQCKVFNLARIYLKMTTIHKSMINKKKTKKLANNGWVCQSVVPSHHFTCHYVG